MRLCPDASHIEPGLYFKSSYEEAGRGRTSHDAGGVCERRYGVTEEKEEKAKAEAEGSKDDGE